MEVGRLIEHESVAVAKDVGREPATESKVTHLQYRSKTTLDERLSRLEVLAGDRQLLFLGQLPHRRNVDGGVGGSHDERSVFLQGSIGVAH